MIGLSRAWNVDLLVIETSMQ